MINPCSVCPAVRGFLAIICLTFLSVNPVASQNVVLPAVGQWSMFFGQVRFHEKWSVHAEAQYRDYGIFDEAEQILLRGGINYHHNSNVMFSGGYGRISNYGYDGEVLETPTASEHRLWQQFIMRDNIARVKFEQRWLQSMNETRYLDRLRYLLRITVPLNKKEMVKNSVFLSFYDEIFIHVTPTPFDRNRLYGAAGFQFSPHGNVQLGYLAQTVNNETKSYLQLALFYTLDLLGDKKDSH